MLVRKIVRTVCGVALLAILATSVTGASFDASRTTHFTFSGPIRLPGVTLPAGVYTFSVVNTNGGTDVVSVTSRDRSKVYLMRLTRPVYRPSASTLKAAITFGETPAGTAPTVKAWYPENETRGREFIY